MPQPSTLLICTVGGSPEPVVAALKQWRPARVRFVHTPKTRDTIAEARRVVRAEGLDLDEGRCDFLNLLDGQDLASCLDKLSRSLSSDVEEWLARGADFRVVVDLTGGTKIMSAALGILASRWPCLFSYVGGAERTKDGVGIVKSGAETIVQQVNPWDALGHHTVEDFIVLFDQRAFIAAAQAAAEAKIRVGRADRKREMNALEQLASAFDAWDRFDHQRSRARFEDVVKSANDLRAVLGSGKGERVLNEIERIAGHVGKLCDSTPPSRHHVVDLLANAQRRKKEGRVDDAVARLYRAIEAIAQVALKERHEFGDTERVSLDRLPEPLRRQWTVRAKDGVVALGLRDAYVLLAALGDPLGQRFMDANLDGAKSPLTARNRSILAHGFDRVSVNIFDKLLESALALAEIQDTDLPSFPTLGESDSG